MAPKNESNGTSDERLVQKMAATTNPSRQLHTTQTDTKLRQTRVPVFKSQKDEYIEFEQIFLYYIRPF